MATKPELAKAEAAICVLGVLVNVALACLLGFVLGGVAWLRRGDAAAEIPANASEFNRAGSAPAD